MATHPNTRRIVALTLSIVAHAGIAAFLYWTVTLPDLGIEFEFPAEVEFGVVEGSELKLPAAGSSEAEQATPPSSASESGEQPAKKPAAPKEPTKDQDNDGAKSKTDKAQGKDDKLSMPPGAQIALRVDMKRVRSSPLGGDVGLLLASVPDWQLLLEGSGVKPVDDLDRLMIASPNLQRSKLVIAGEHRGQNDEARQAAKRLADSHGVPLEWRQEYGVEISTWANKDDTPRVIALLDTKRFAIARAEDIPKVLAAAQTRQGQRDANDTQESRWDIEGLLGLDSAAVVSLEVENARTFARGFADKVPLRFSANIVETQEGQVRILMTGEYESRAVAQTAEAFWNATKDRYANHLRGMGVFSLGMAGPLSAGTITASHKRIKAEFQLSHSQVRILLGLIQDRLKSWQRSRTDPPASPTPPKP
jgi:hypothetical protein